jgi:hypothetical protein
VPQAPPACLACRQLARRRAGQNHVVPITYDPGAGAARIHLTGDPLSPGRTTIQAGTPPAVPGFVAFDRKGDRLAGIEIPGASARLHCDLPGQAEITG